MSETQSEFLKTREDCYTALENNPASLPPIPKEFMDEDMAIFAVEQNVELLKDLPEELVTKRVAMTAVIKDERALDLLSPEKRTYDVVVVAVQEHPNLYPDLTEDLYKNDCLIAEKFLKAFPEKISEVPSMALIRSSAMHAVSYQGELIREIPEHMRDSRICDAAVKNATSVEDVLPYVPENEKNLKFFSKMIHERPESAKLVPEEFKETLATQIAWAPYYAEADTIMHNNEDLIQNWIDKNTEDRSFDIGLTALIYDSEYGDLEEKNYNLAYNFRLEPDQFLISVQNSESRDENNFNREDFKQDLRDTIRENLAHAIHEVVSKIITQDESAKQNLTESHSRGR